MFARPEHEFEPLALAEWLQDKGMKHSRGAPYHPQTQGKIPLVTLLRNALPGSDARLCSAALRTGGGSRHDTTDAQKSSSQQSLLRHS